MTGVAGKGKAIQKKNLKKNPLCREDTCRRANGIPLKQLEDGISALPAGWAWGKAHFNVRVNSENKFTVCGTFFPLALFHS